MRVYETQHIRNAVLLGHAGCGKTSLAEAILFFAGATTRRGSIQERNTISDYHEIEHERGTSVFASLLTFEWNGHKLNLLDTPGYDDFIGQVLPAMRVADLGLLLVNLQSGVEVGTELLWKYTEQERLPVAFVLSKPDGEQANFERTLAHIQQRLTSSIAVLHYPVGEGAHVQGIVDVLSQRLYGPDMPGTPAQPQPVPQSEQERLQRFREQLMEAVAVADEQLMEAYFAKGELSPEELRRGLRHAILQRAVFPVLCAGAETAIGLARLLHFLTDIFPAPTELPPIHTTDGKPLRCDSSEPAVAFVYRTLSEPSLGDMSFMRVYSGTLRAGMELVNAQTGATERLPQLFTVLGKKRTEVTPIVAGDLAATVKLRNTHTNNTLHEKGAVAYTLPLIEFPPPRVRVAVLPVKKGDEEKVGSALHQLQEEDPSYRVEHAQELRQIILHGQGELHLAVARWLLLHRFRVEAEFVEPRIPYRETIQKPAKGYYKHKKQTGGAGQYAEVHLLVEPYTNGMPDPAGLTVRSKEEHDLPWGGKLVFLNCIVGGVIDTRFMPAILKGIMEKMQDGPLTGSYVRDIRVSVFDGKMHPVDSNEAAFKIAGMMAFKHAFLEADPRVLEPIYEVTITVPDEFVGAVISDLPSRRAVILGVESDGHYQRIRAHMPLAELDKYSAALRSLTQGRATYMQRFIEYVPVPPHIQQKLVEEHRTHVAEEA
ncbi:MAG: elongation factor G [Candidatus Kapabacteria bacterium]|nr:elongation factor G [Candidatus Kapabacteria bacterium]